MIGSGLKKLAEENGMTVAHGVAYGNLGGFSATFSEGAGWKRIDFATRFLNEEKKQGFISEVNKVNLVKTYRIQRLGMGERMLQVIFQDQKGTMDKIREFLSWFLPLLSTYEATGADICCQCGCQVTAGKWVLVENNAFYMHDACAQKVVRDIEESNQSRKDELAGSYGGGILGALAGSAIGAALWAVLLMMGYVASLAGLAIGFLAEKGYNLLKGKQGKGKLWILIVAILFGILLGTLGGYTVMLMKELDFQISVGESFTAIVQAISQDADARTEFLSNMGMGILFAALGVYGILRNTRKAVADTKVTVLE